MIFLGVLSSPLNGALFLCFSFLFSIFLIESVIDANKFTNITLE